MSATHLLPALALMPAIKGTAPGEAEAERGDLQALIHAHLSA